MLTGTARPIWAMVWAKRAVAMFFPSLWVEDVSATGSVLLVEPMLTPSTSARHFLLTGLNKF